jgi:hypothetical protein
MATFSIWAKAKGKPPEKVDDASSEKQAQYLAREYQMAFGPGFVVWAGRKDQQPKTE